MLGGGGVLGDAWMCSVLAGLEESGRIDPAAAGRFVGTSAGSMVATRLAAGVDLPRYVRHRIEKTGSDGWQESRRPGTGARGPVDLEGSFAETHLMGAASHPFNGFAGRWIRRAVLGQIPEGRQELGRLGESMDRIAPEWDPRLNIVGVRSATAERVVFSADSDHGLRVSEAVRASCAIPGVFKAVQGSDGSYVDGGVWSPANLDAVTSSAGESVVALLPIGAAAENGYGRSRVTFEVFRSIVAGEVVRLRRKGVRVVTVAPDPTSAAAIGPDRMDSRREAAVGRAGLAQGRTLAEPLSAWLQDS